MSIDRVGSDVAKANGLTTAFVWLIVGGTVIAGAATGSKALLVIAAVLAVVLSVASGSLRVIRRPKVPREDLTPHAFPTGRYVAIVATAAVVLGYLGAGVLGALALGIFATLTSLLGLGVARRFERSTYAHSNVRDQADTNRSN